MKRENSKPYWKTLKLSALRGAKLFLSPSRWDKVEEVNQEEFYNQTFSNLKVYLQHYTLSTYYFMWAVIVDRIRRARVRSVLEVGCGTGQLAHAIYDADIIESYCGFDISKVGISQARRNVPIYRFEVADASQSDLFKSCMYDMVISTECLEHVEMDLSIINSIRPGSRFIASVPNFPYVSHLRHFKDCEEVARRYSQFFRNFTVDPLFANEEGSTYFLIEGIKTTS